MLFIVVIDLAGNKWFCFFVREMV